MQTVVFAQSCRRILEHPNQGMQVATLESAHTPPTEMADASVNFSTAAFPHRLEGQKKTSRKVVLHSMT